MTALLCLLMTLTIGLHFGGRFAQAHLGGQSLIPSVLAQAVLSALMVSLSLLFGSQAGDLLALGVALTTLLSFAAGTLWQAAKLGQAPGQATAPRSYPVQAAGAGFSVAGD